MMYFFLLKKTTTTAKKLFGDNKLVDFSKNLSKKNQKQTSLTLLKTGVNMMLRILNWSGTIIKTHKGAGTQTLYSPLPKNHSYANKNEKNRSWNKNNNEKK